MDEDDDGEESWKDKEQEEPEKSQEQGAFIFDIHKKRGHREKARK